MDFCVCNNFWSFLYFVPSIEYLTTMAKNIIIAIRNNNEENSSFLKLSFQRANIAIANPKFILAFSVYGLSIFLAIKKIYLNLSEKNYTTHTNENEISTHEETLNFTRAFTSSGRSTSANRKIDSLRSSPSWTKQFSQIFQIENFCLLNIEQNF